MDDQIPHQGLDAGLIERFQQAVHDTEAEPLRRLLAAHPELATVLDAPLFAFDAPAVVKAASLGNRQVLETLLDAGADIDAKSAWEAGPFGALHHTCFDHPELAAWLVSRGAAVDIHAAAGMGDRRRLEEFLQADPERLHQRGPDGQLPLHFAADVEIAEWLLDAGAELDAVCVDHGSTAAQYALVRAPEITRFLLARGARGDIFLAAALGDEDLARRLIDQQPGCLAARLGRSGYDPVQPGNILDWTLGWWSSIGGRASPHMVATCRGHEGIYGLLWDASPPVVRLLVAAEHGEDETAREIAARHPALVPDLHPEDARFLADMAWNGNVRAVRILLQAGFDPHLAGSHDSTPLDRAAFHGFADILQLLLEHDPSPPVARRNEFGGTPLEALIYGCVHGWRTDGDPVRAARLLAEAGSEVTAEMLTRAPKEVAEALRPFVG